MCAGIGGGGASGTCKGIGGGASAVSGDVGAVGCGACGGHGSAEPAGQGSAGASSLTGVRLGIGGGDAGHGSEEGGAQPGGWWSGGRMASFGDFFFEASFGEKGFAGMCAKASNADGLGDGAGCRGDHAGLSGTRGDLGPPAPALTTLNNRSQAIDAWILAVVDTAF